MTTTTSAPALPPILFDRTRYQTGLSCLRKRWYEFEYPTPSGGRGIRPRALSLPLLIGSATHAGLAHLLLGAQKGEDWLEGAVVAALHGQEGFWPTLDAMRLALEEGQGEGDVPRMQREGAALVEGMLRAYALRRLPLLMEGGEEQAWRVREVEREDLFRFGGGELGLMARADALLEEVCSGDLYIQSFKTAGQWDSRQEKANRYDIQGLSELMAVQDRLTRDYKAIPPHEPHDAPPRIMGVRMEFLLKGRRAQWPEGSGNWVTFSPLTTGYKTRGGVPGPTRYAWSWDWADPDDVNPQTGRPVKHTLGGKAWERFWVWEEAGLGAEDERVRNWIAMLASGECQPEAGDPFAGCFHVPETYFRQDEHIERLARQMEARERRIHLAADTLRNTDPGTLAAQAVLDEEFPQNPQRCAYPGLCEYAPFCWEGVEPERALGDGDFLPRVPHHRPEADGLEQGKLERGKGEEGK